MEGRGGAGLEYWVLRERADGILGIPDPIEETDGGLEGGNPPFG
jgi:hypothetical protein